jgi:alpha-tubulin suppressor-like RCC1 family protein
MHLSFDRWSHHLMVRWLALFVAALFVTSIAACGSDTSDGQITSAGADAADAGAESDGADGSEADARLQSPVFAEIVSGPASLTNQTSAVFELTCNRDGGCTFACSLNANSLDASEYGACSSLPTYENLPNGEHVFRALAIDAGGRTSEPETWAWVVDAESPVVEITEAPGAQTPERSASFEFACTNEETCSFECSLDEAPGAGDWQPCSSPHSLADLAPGDHTLRIRATDPAGNQGLASHHWTVVWSSRTTVSINYQHTCAIAANGGLWCWGPNSYGILGDGTTLQRSVPVQVGSDTNWAQVHAGSSSTCGLRDDQTLWCWGHNGFGEMGDGTTSTGRLSPGQVGSDANWAQASNAGVYNCSLRDDQTLWCWGRNDVGQLGDGTTTDRHLPAQLGTDADWTSVSSGYMNTVCAIRADQTLWCWDENSRGKVGDGTVETRHAPVQVGSGADWAQVSVGGVATCGLRDDQTLWCWGEESYGIVGGDTSERRRSPMQIGSGDNWTQVAVGGRHACAIRADHTLWCWGSNTSGALANPSVADQHAPQQVGADTDWMQVSAGFNAACGVRADETVWCWGENAKGQVGNATTTNQYAPVEVLNPTAL